MRIAHKAAGLCLAALVALTVFACSGRRLDWTKPGAGPEEMQSDLIACATQAGAMTPQYFDARTRSVISDPQDATQLKYSCMIAHGWQMAPASGLPP